GRVRTGSQDAATELVRRYEPLVRRTIRLRLRDSRLRRELDSLDICQSVLGSFFVRTALGQYQLDSPDDLVKLLQVMARNKLAGQGRKPRAEREDGLNGEEVIAAGASPSREVAARNLLEEVRKRLPEADRRMAELRTQGKEWAEIAVELGGSAEALRKRYG